MCGNLMIPTSVWPIKEGMVISRASVLTHSYLLYWQLIRKGKLKRQKYGKDYFSMHQWKRIYNTSRIPGDPKDSLVNYFKTEQEGEMGPRNIIVLMNGHIFTVDVIDVDGRILTVAELEAQFKDIEEQCKNRGAGPGISALTVDERSSWCKNRERLINLNAKNKKNLKTIEGALFAVSFDSINKPTEELAVFHTVFGDCQNRWYEKSFNVNIFKNGAVTGCADHMPSDAMTLVNGMQYANGYVESVKNNDTLDHTYKIRPLQRPEKLDFTLDEHILKSIHDVTVAHNKRSKGVKIIAKSFSDHGKGYIKKQKMHPDTYIQLVMQLAYYRLHKKPAPTYETASTRAFYHGRTETLRSCTCESVEWMQAMVDDNISNAEKVALMKKAYEKHNQLMSDGMKGGGCDRHLFGLMHVAREEGLPTPEIFTDPSWTKSGGGGNFILSSSLAGYSHLGGGTLPMCLDGYAVFYSIEEYRVNFFISSFTSSKESDADNLFESLCQTLRDVERMLTSTNV
ncbi:CROT (predicted) [Pycnogonum litorale]